MRGGKVGRHGSRSRYLRQSPQLGLLLRAELGQFGKGLRNRDLCPVPNPEGNAHQHVPELLGPGHFRKTKVLHGFLSRDLAQIAGAHRNILEDVPNTLPSGEGHLAGGVGRARHRRSGFRVWLSCSGIFGPPFVVMPALMVGPKLPSCIKSPRLAGPIAFAPSETYGWDGRWERDWANLRPQRYAGWAWPESP